MDAATVVVLREGDAGMEVLMLKKNSKIYFGGMWVFPGGRVDPEDADVDDASEFGRFERAAIREAHEEAAIDLKQTNGPRGIAPQPRGRAPQQRPTQLLRGSSSRPRYR